MKIRLEYITAGEEELIWRKRKRLESNGEDRREREQDERAPGDIRDFIVEKEKKLTGTCGKELVYFTPMEIYYLEYVENQVFAYLKEQVVGVSFSLEKAEERFREKGFFRCSKSMLVNLNKVQKFESTVGNRMTARLNNGEVIVVSRHYARILRAYLRGEE